MATFVNALLHSKVTCPLYIGRILEAKTKGTIFFNYKKINYSANVMPNTDRTEERKFKRDLWLPTPLHARA